MDQRNEDVPEFECWNVLVDIGDGRGNETIAFSHFTINGPRFMLLSQVRRAGWRAFAC